LKPEAGGAAAFAQALFDLMFADIDRSLREMGVGDLGVGRHVKRMAQGFYGRIAAYEGGLEGDDDALRDALRRNLYGTVEPAEDALAAMVAYCRRAASRLAEQPAGELLDAVIAFDDPGGEGAA
jgi:cytochrome b pre-mRNA-processing protein 3